MSPDVAAQLSVDQPVTVRGRRRLRRDHRRDRRKRWAELPCADSPGRRRRGAT
ncbi:MAG: hypothetical protein R2856_04700 [Caldilineaceae bacterium]